MHPNLLSVSVMFITQSCPTLCDPMDYKPPDSSVHGIFQARILEWVAIYCRFFQSFFSHLESSITSLRIFFKKSWECWSVLSSSITSAEMFTEYFPFNLVNRYGSTDRFFWCWTIPVLLCKTHLLSMDFHIYFKTSWYLIIAYLFIKETTLFLSYLCVFFLLLLWLFVILAMPGGPGQWKHRVLTTGPPGNSLVGFYIRDFLNS